MKNMQKVKVSANIAEDVAAELEQIIAKANDCLNAINAGEVDPMQCTFIKELTGITIK